MSKNNFLEQLEIKNSNEIGLDASKSINNDKEISGSKLGKFNDVESLVSAYENLEKSYTKKCQKLSEFEKKDNENFVGKGDNKLESSSDVNEKLANNLNKNLKIDEKVNNLLEKNNILNSLASNNNNFSLNESIINNDKNINENNLSNIDDKNNIMQNENVNLTDENNNSNKQGIENIKSSIDKVNENNNVNNLNTTSNLPQYENINWKPQVYEFLCKNPNAKNYVKDIANELYLDKNLSSLDNALELAYSKVLAKKYVEPERLLEDEDFVKNHIFTNENIKNQIINNYLKNVKSGSTPPIVLKGIGSIASGAIKNNPKSLDDAKKLFASMFLG